MTWLMSIWALPIYVEHEENEDAALKELNIKEVLCALKV